MILNWNSIIAEREKERVNVIIWADNVPYYDHHIEVSATSRIYII